MSITVNPATWAGWNLRAKDQQFDQKMQLLLAQISEWALQMQSTVTQSGLAAILNGSLALQQSSLLTFQRNLNGLSTNQTFACDGASVIALQLAWSSGTNLTVNLTHVALGALVFLWFVNGTGAATGFGIGATNPAGTAYTVNGVAAGSASGAGITNLGAGTTITNNAAMGFWGTSVGTTVMILNH